MHRLGLIALILLISGAPTYQDGTAAAGGPEGSGERGDAEVLAGPTLRIEPTRASGAAALPLIRATPQHPSKPAGKQEKSASGKTVTKKSSAPTPAEDRLDTVPPGVEPHFSFTNELREGGGGGQSELTPTRSVPVSSSLKPGISWTWPSSGLLPQQQGEGRGAPSSGLGAPPPPSLSSSPLHQQPSAPRKSSPDIQEIISGFVKLLNGAPNHQNGGRPVRTRINNRGPPRITDVPPLVLEPAGGVGPAALPPSLLRPRDPPPYPFERPLEKPVIKPFFTGVPLPEQIVPPQPGQEPLPMRPPLRPIRPKPTEPDEDKSKDTTKVVKEPTTASSQEQEVTPTTTAVTTNATVLGVETSSTVTAVQNTTPPTQPPPDTTQNATTESSTNTSLTETATIKETNTSMQVNTTTTSTTSKPETNMATTDSSTSSNVTTSTEASPSKKPNEKKPVSTSKTTQPPVTTSSVISSTTIEPSIVEIVTLSDAHKPTKWNHSAIPTPPKGFSPRPGIVLDDPEYKPGGGKRPLGHHPLSPGLHQKGEIFDITVSAVQGPDASKTGQPLVYPVELEGVSLPGNGAAGGGGAGEVSVITSAEAGQHFVSIDGKRTYISLFGSSTESPSIKPTPASASRPLLKPTQGSYSSSGVPGGSRVKRPPGGGRRPQQPPVRIDTCIVGDWSTCDSEQHETCRTEQGVSSCHCAPGYSRQTHRQPCKRVVSLLASIQIDKFYDHKVSWSEKLRDPESQEYLQLEYEAIRAMESAMSMTPFSDAYMGSKVNAIFTTPGSPQKPVFINMTLQVEENAENLRPQVKQEIQKHLLGAIHRRGNNIGTSNLWAPATNGVSHLQDLDECSSPELNDCHPAATCRNTFGSFECTCPPGFKDEFGTSPTRAGRRCQTCGPEQCNHRGSCSYNNGMPQCQCTGNYYGSQCEVDGEVLGVAIGASVAAVIIILSTLACLCMWSRRWNKEQKLGMGSPVFGYMPSGGSTVKTPGIGAPPYQVSLEDRLRWAQIADVMAHTTNHYAPEPVGLQTRPPSAMFGYGGTLPMAPMPLPRLGLRSGANTTRQDSSSEEEDRDRADLLGRNFQVPRPKSRSSIANQSGIYYDVDYEQQTDHYPTTKSHPGCIALNTYTMGGRAHYYRT